VLDLAAIFSAVSTETPLQLQAKLGGRWLEVGSGELSALTPDRVEFSGELFTIEPGPVSLMLSLAEGGGGEIRLRGARDAAAVWWPYGDGIVLTATLAGRPGELTLWPGGGGVYLTIAGAVSAQLWLGSQ
jgi:hypothetical protein